MTVRIGVVVFPGSNCDTDTEHGLRLAGAEPVALWHEDVDLAAVAAVVLPGGFAYGDYLRAGVIARFSPVMRAVSAFAADGGLVLGICNGFQVLAEAGLVPGALLRNRGLRFLGRDVHIVPGRLDSPFTRALPDLRPLRLPIAHGEGCFYADDEALDRLEADGQVLFRYADPDGVRPRRRRRVEPERFAAGDRRRHERRRERRRAHAPPGTSGGGAPRVGRRPRDPPFARRLGGGAARGRHRPRRGPVRGPGGRAMTAEAMPTEAERPVTGAPGGTDPTTDALHRSLGLTDEELAAIRDRLGRDPNDLELAMFSVMWSEHCSYKSSKPLLASLPTAGAGVVAGPGENAGVIDIGDGLAVAFKIESHNHPSAVEPYQGAATGVGGILRDIFTMGARPVAILDALRFGDPAEARTRRLVDGVVRGVGGYGNCVGVPTVGGELVFDPCYGGNPLVNVMAIGVLPIDRLTRATAPGPGNLVVLFGSTTGRDGIGGASVLASATFGEDDLSRRPAVQVGDPFAEKLLIEASLELIERGLVEGLQDLGAGGITCATSEVADRAGTGISVDLTAIPRREPGMAPFEVMISESQERMCAIVRPERWEDVRGVCDRWGIPVAVIGRVTDDGDIAGRATTRPRARPDPGPGPHLGRDRPSPPRRATAAATGGPGARAGGRGRRWPPRAGDGPRGGPPRPPRLGQRRVAPVGHRPVRLDGPDRHGRGTRAWRGGHPDQGHEPGPRRGDRREPRGRRDRSMARAPSSASPRRPAMSPSPGPARSASRTASTTAIRPARKRSGSSPRPSAASATPVGLSACR